MTSHIHSGPARIIRQLPGRCEWSFEYSGVVLTCDDTVLPGSNLCSDHYIAAVHRRYPYRTWRTAG